ncbi:hypothetical protein AB0M20_17080 [Actinoplanes sp. NPDC051633]|uniref:hypothetical protein n=1 Tax=Actinoplanes sp. NPDC051633 TaxID=3155670 RepID=UPI0034152358
MTMNPDQGAPADRTLAGSWSIVTTANKGYTLTMQCRRLSGSEGTLTQTSATIAGAVTTFPTNRFGYNLTVAGTVHGHLHVDAGPLIR